MIPVRAALLAAAAVLLGACGSETGDPSISGINNASSPPSAAASTRTPTNDPGGDACAVLEFTASESFTAHEFLFFDFEHPAGWVHRQASHGQLSHGYISPKENERIGIEYIVTPVPMDPAISTQIREAQMNRLETIAYAGQAIQIYERSFPEVTKTNIGVNLPHGDENYSFVVNFQGPKGCDMAEVEALRSLFTGSLTPNDDTTFEPMQ